MQEEIADLVHAVIDHGLDVKERLDRGEAPVLRPSRRRLKQLLSGRERGQAATPTSTTELDIRYALVCWLDELFILDPAWGTQWNEHKLEVALFGTNDRAWKFWEKARRPLTRTDSDVLEVYYLCVMLGFRGELRDDPAGSRPGRPPRARRSSGTRCRRGCPPRARPAQRRARRCTAASGSAGWSSAAAWRC